MSNILLYIMIAAPIGFTPFADNPKEFISRTGIAHGINLASTFGTKAIVDRVRPDGTGHDSFYSGHTSTAFTSSGAICSERFGPVCWISLGVAGAVGAFRVTENRHHPSDVLVGALLGFGTGSLVLRW